jgi:hypothetical protein
VIVNGLFLNQPWRTSAASCPLAMRFVRRGHYLMFLYAMAIYYVMAREDPRMYMTKHPRLLARLAGLCYVCIIVLALFAYRYVRGQLMVPGDIAQTANNILAHERLYRLSLAAGVVVVMCNLPVGLVFYELLKVVNRLLALLALLFLLVAETLEASNLLIHIQPLLTLTLREVQGAFAADQKLALARMSNRLFPVAFSVSLSFFGVFCFLVGSHILKAKFFPKILGVLMVLAGLCYLIDNFAGLLALPSPPFVARVPLVAESSLALWLLIVGVNEEKWREQANAIPGA